MKQRRIRCLAAAAFVLLFLGAAWFTGCDLSLMWSLRDHLTDIAAKMFPPDWGFLGKVLPLLWATIQMSITGTFLGAVLSIPAAMACAASLPGPGPAKKAVRFCIQVLRSFPALILALLATFFLGIGSFAGTAGYGRRLSPGVLPLHLTGDPAGLSHQRPLSAGGQCAAQRHPGLCGRRRDRPAAQ